MGSDLPAGAITGHIDVAQAAFWLFFLLFLGLVYVLRRYDKLEGYPLIDPEGPRRAGFPVMPPPHPQLRHDGTWTQMPHDDDPPPMSYREGRVAGDPLIPVGDPLASNLGPGTWVPRRDEPFTSDDGAPQVVPMRAAPGWDVAQGDPDPRGMRVVDAEHKPVGTVRDLWVDRGTKWLRYIEIELDGDAGGGPLLIPTHWTDTVESRREVRVTALHAHQFALAPRLRADDRITAREEDMVTGFFAGGRFHLQSTGPAARPRSMPGVRPA